MNISEPPPLRSAQARIETGSVCSSVSFLSRSAVEDEVGRHQLGQRRRVGGRVGVALGQRLVASSGRARGSSWPRLRAAAAPAPRRRRQRRADKRRRRATGGGTRAWGRDRRGCRREVSGNAAVRPAPGRAVHARSRSSAASAGHGRSGRRPGRRSPAAICGRAQSRVAASGTTSSTSPWMTSVSAGTSAHLLLLGRRADQHQPARLRIVGQALRRLRRRRSRRTRSRRAAAAGRRIVAARRDHTASASSTSPRPSSHAPCGRADAAEVEAHAAPSRAARRRAPASARPCCPSCRRAADADGRPPPRRAALPPARRSRTRSRRPARRSAREPFAVHRAPRGSAADVGRQQQALDDLAVLQVRVDDLVDVAAVDVGVPDRLRDRPPRPARRRSGPGSRPC